MSELKSRFLGASRNIQIAAYSGLILRISLLCLLNVNKNKDVNLYHYIDIFNIYGGITICAIIVLLYGIYKANHYFIIPYIAVSIIEIPLTSIGLTFDVVLMLYSVHYEMLFVTLIGCAMIFWNFFTTWLLMTNYRQLDVQHKLASQLKEISEKYFPSASLTVETHQKNTIAMKILFSYPYIESEEMVA